MPFDPDLLDLMSSIVQYKQFSSRDVYANAAFVGDPGPYPTFPAHITYKRKITRDDSGDEAVSTAQIQIPPVGYIWLNGDFPYVIPYVTTADRFLLPLDGVERKVLTATRYTDEDTYIAGGGSSTLPEHHQSIELT